MNDKKHFRTIRRPQIHFPEGRASHAHRKRMRLTGNGRRGAAAARVQRLRPQFMLGFDLLDDDPSQDAILAFVAQRAG
jgi:hypothetical protein